MTPKIAVSLTLALVLITGCDLAVPVGDSLAPAFTADNDARQTEGTRGADITDGGDGQMAARSAVSNATQEADASGASGSSDDRSSTTTTHAAESNAAMPSGGMIVPDVSDGLPQGHPGSGERLVSDRRPTTRTANMAVFRTRCEFSHMNFDDPIVHPGEPGASHLHAYFGNKSANAESTARSISSSGRSTCAGGIVNRTAYWVPALVDTKTRKPVAPRFAVIYYRSGQRGVALESIESLPKGLRMIAGNAMSAHGTDNPEIEWACKTKGTSSAQGESLPYIPSDCVQGDVLRMRVMFPQCWDGKNLDSSDHKSHMAYPKGGCPAAHPVALPMIVLNVVYEIDDPSAVDHWRLVSDMYDRSSPGGMSAHADWFNGWDQATTDAWLVNCIRSGNDCGTDNLNNGTGLDRP